MPPIALSKSDPATVAQFTVEQVVSFAGNGKLSDGSQCSEELRVDLSRFGAAPLIAYCTAEEMSCGTNTDGLDVSRFRSGQVLMLCGLSFEGDSYVWTADTAGLCHHMAAPRSEYPSEPILP